MRKRKRWRETLLAGQEMTEREKSIGTPEAAGLIFYVLFDAYTNDQIIDYLPTENLKQQFITMITNPRLKQPEFDKFVTTQIPNFLWKMEEWRREFEYGGFNEYDFTENNELVRKQ